MPLEMKNELSLKLKHLFTSKKDNDGQNITQFDIFVFHFVISYTDLVVN